MTRVTIRAAAIALFVLGVAASLQRDAQAQGFPKEFKNLQVVDKKIAPDDLKKMMNGFTEQLGVKCTFCHNTENYSSDERKHKADARKMIVLVQHMLANKGKYFKADVAVESLVKPAPESASDARRLSQLVPR
jgi:hypothetical protein